MKFIKWKSLIISCFVCIAAIIPGIILWDKLPDQMAIHFDIYNNPDNFSSKAFAVFFLPVLMAFVQASCCFINDINAHKHGERVKFTLVTKSIVPSLTVILQLVTLGYNLGWNLNIQKIVAVIVGMVFLLIGNYMPKFDYIKNYDLDADISRKINRFIGFEMVIMGILFIISAFLKPIATLVCLILLIPYSIIAVVYGIVTARKK